MENPGFQELLTEFLLEARERADEVESLMLRLTSGDPEARRTAVTQAKRELHTLKGNSGMMGFADLQQLAHQLEDEVEGLDLGQPRLEDILTGIDVLRQGLEAIAMPETAPRSREDATEGAKGPADGIGARTGGGESLGELGSVRVPFAKIDQLVEIQAETLIFRNRLADAVASALALVRASGVERAGEASADGVSRAEQQELLLTSIEAVEEARQALEKTLNVLQGHATELGMVPLQSLFRSLGRVVHDESAREGKRVALQVEGGDTPIDKTLLEVASDVLGHLVRNAVIHGIEEPEDRRRLGKPESGTVSITAALEGGEVRIEVTDDGGGVDVPALRAKAAAVAPELGERGSAFELLFADGLSTRHGADLGSGRGVGLSAVKRSVERHSGRIEVFSERHRGSTFMLRLPLTTSIMRSLLIAVDGEEYALPLGAVTESQRLEDLDAHELNRARVVPWRGHVIPLLDLGIAFGTAEQVRDTGFFVVIEVSGRPRGLAIDDIRGIRDIVVKGLDSIVGKPTGISGSTILGDGRVIMILDPHALATIPPFVGPEKPI